MTSDEVFAFGWSSEAGRSRYLLSKCHAARKSRLNGGPLQDGIKGGTTEEMPFRPLRRKVFLLYMTCRTKQNWIGSHDEEVELHERSAGQQIKHVDADDIRS